MWNGLPTIPEGWALDASGVPTTSVEAALKGGMLMPLGGYKGYGLAMMVEILSAALAGLTFADPRLGRRPRVGHFVMALDPTRFSDAGDFRDYVDALIDAMHGTDPINPARPVLVPGDPERAMLAERRANGIPLTPSVVEDLREVARASGVPFLLDESPS